VRSTWSVETESEVSGNILTFQTGKIRDVLHEMHGIVDKLDLDISKLPDCSLSHYRAANCSPESGGGKSANSLSGPSISESVIHKFPENKELTESKSGYSTGF
jgi:hypothetical protein